MNKTWIERTNASRLSMLLQSLRPFHFTIIFISFSLTKDDPLPNFISDYNLHTKEDEHNLIRPLPPPLHPPLHSPPLPLTHRRSPPPPPLLLPHLRPRHLQPQRVPPRPLHPRSAVCIRWVCAGGGGVWGEDRGRLTEKEWSSSVRGELGSELGASMLLY